jgi:hypothetical protein
MSANPYDVLGVAPTASQDELRRAFRRALRASHPDTGGDQVLFVAVQLAWEQVGDPAARSAYDAGRGPRLEHVTFTAAATSTSRQDRPRARAYGHPGGWRREQYLGMIREWAGRGVELDNPYDPALVRSAPREIRRTLADAIAEETTSRMLAQLGIGWTVWHDVSTGAPDRKVDHVVLGPSGLFAFMSEDFGGPVRVRKGELIGDAVSGERPVHELAERVRALTRATRVRFTTVGLVLPDDALEEPWVDLGRIRGSEAIAVRQSALRTLIEGGRSSGAIGGTELFDLRTKLQAGLRLVQ